MHLHFSKFNNICHFSDHLTNLSRSSCKRCLSVSCLTLLNTFVLSANVSTLLGMSSSKSFIYNKHSIGHNTDARGTSSIFAPYIHTVMAFPLFMTLSTFLMIKSSKNTWAFLVFPCDTTSVKLFSLCVIRLPFSCCTLCLLPSVFLC